MVDDIATILPIDPGSHTTKCGYAGDDTPNFTLHSIIGFSSAFRQPLVGYQEKPFYIGDEAFMKKGSLNIQNIFNKGHVQNFDYFEKFLDHVIRKELRAEPQYQPLISTEKSGIEPYERQKIVEMVFEKFNIPGYYVMNNSLSSLYASGRTTGTVLNIGEEISSVVPIYESEILSHAVQLGSIAGKQINDYLKLLIQEKDSYLRTNDIIRDIKEKLCFSSLDFEKEIKSNDLGRDYELPDGNIISFKRELIMAPELIFKPENIDIKDDSIDKKIVSSINNCPSVIEKELIGNILLSGGSTLFKGFQYRLINELKSFYIKPLNVKVIAPPERKWASWIGISILGSLNTFSKYLMSQQEYQEYGSKIVEWKCPSSYSIFQNCYKNSISLFRKNLFDSQKSCNINLYFI